MREVRGFLVQNLEPQALGITADVLNLAHQLGEVPAPHLVEVDGESHQPEQGSTPCAGASKSRPRD